MDKRPIGIFDSGLGGLTGLIALRAMLPEEIPDQVGDDKQETGGAPAIEELTLF